jgi:choline dehydrogenase
MPESFDFIVVGAGSAGAVIAARLTEDPTCRVLLLEAGGRPPAAELVPAAVGSLQLNPETDWMYTADAGRCGLGLAGGRMMVPRGRMLGGSSGINYLGYVRGHPGDFDAWAAGGADGWGYAEVLPYFRKSEGLAASDDIVTDAAAHNADGPLGVSVRMPVLEAAATFVAAAEAAGIPRGDYNGRDRGGPAGVVSLLQTTSRGGRRSSTFHAFLEGAVEDRPNLTIVTGAHVTRVLLGGHPGGPVATGVAYIDADEENRTASASREVVLCAGAIGSPQLLMLSGVGPRAELEAAGVACLVDSPHVGKHLKDHLHLPLFFPAPGLGVPVGEIGISLGSDALRAPAGPLPADPAEDADLPAELLALKAEADRRITEWATTGTGLASSSMYEAAAWFSTGLGDHHTHDAQVAFLATGFTPDFWRYVLRVEPADWFADPAAMLALDAENVVVLANPVQPHSEGEVVLHSADPTAAPDIRMNYYADPHDLPVMVAVARRALEIVRNWPGGRALGPLQVPPALALKHGHVEGEDPSDALLADLALHYSLTVYHATSTCRIGDVVDANLRVAGVGRLRVADASVMPNVISGNTNAPTIMIGEKAAELLAGDHGVKLTEFVGL